MFNSEQLLSIHRIASFCLANIANNDSFAAYAGTEEISLAFDVHRHIQAGEEVDPNLSISDVVLKVFSTYLETSSEFKPEPKFSEITAETNLDILKQEAIRAEHMLQAIRMTGSTDDYMHIFVIINRVLTLIQQQEEQNISNNLARLFLDIRRLREELLNLVQMEGLDINSEYVRGMFILYDFALSNTLAYNAKLIHSAWFDEGKQDFVLKLIDTCQKRSDNLFSVIHNPNGGDCLEINLLKLERKAVIATLAYAQMTIAFSNIENDVETNALKIFVAVNKIRENRIFDDTEWVFAVPNLMEQTIQIVAEWVLQTANKDASENDLKIRSKFLFLATQYLDNSALNALLKYLNDWQLYVSGKHLRIVLDCKLRLEKAYVGNLAYSDLRDYYDFIMGETIETGLKFNPYWDVEDRCNDDAEEMPKDKKIKTPQGKRKDRQLVMSHDINLQKYVVATLDAYPSIDWSKVPYVPTYELDKHPNLRPSFNSFWIPVPGTTETAIVAFDFNRYKDEQDLIASLSALKIRNEESPSPTDPSIATSTSLSNDSDSDEDAEIRMLTSQNDIADDEFSTRAIQRPGTPTPKLGRV